MELMEFLGLMAVLLPWVLFGTFCLLDEKDKQASG